MYIFIYCYILTNKIDIIYIIDIILWELWEAWEVNYGQWENFQTSSFWRTRSAPESRCPEESHQF